MWRLVPTSVVTRFTRSCASLTLILAPPAFFLASHDHPVKRFQQAFARRVRSRLVCSRTNPFLSQLRNSPIFPVRLVPEFHYVIRPEIRFRHFRRVKVPFANHLRPVHRLWPQRVCHYIVRVQAQEQIRIHRVVQHQPSLFFVQPRKIRPPPLSIGTHSLRATAKLH